MKAEELIKGDVIRYNRRACYVSKVKPTGIEVKMFLPYSTFKRTGVWYRGHAMEEVKNAKKA